MEQIYQNLTFDELQQKISDLSFQLPTFCYIETVEAFSLCSYESFAQLSNHSTLQFARLFNPAQQVIIRKMSEGYHLVYLRKETLIPVKEKTILLNISPTNTFSTLHLELMTYKNQQIEFWKEAI